MGTPTYRRPGLQRKILGHLDDRVDEGDHYFKSRRMANLETFSEHDVGAIGHALASLEGADDHSFQFERFSETACTTWRIVRADQDSSVVDTDG